MFTHSRNVAAQDGVMQPPAAPADPATSDTSEMQRTGLPLVSPTWELELLISGAVLLALFQLPSLITGWTDQLRPHGTRAATTVLIMVGLYAKSMTYALIASFVVHLVARAYWVGLVGLYSVYPRGVQWDKLTTQGPITRRIYRQRFATLPSTTARIDNFCSIIFSFAFVIVLFFAISILTMGAVGALAFAVSALAFGGRYFGPIFWSMLTVIFVVPTTAAVVDRLRGDRIAPDSRLARAIEHTMRFFFRIQLVNVYGPIFMTLLTNVRKTIIYPVFYLTFVLVLLAGMLDLLLSVDALRVNSYDYFSESDATGMDPRYYESQRPAGGVYERIPMIQSDIVKDPFVRLFIPYSPARHNQALAAACPTLRPLEPRGLRFSVPIAPPAADSAAAAVLRCLTTMHAVTLNGRRLDSLRFRFTTHEPSGLRGIVAHIPTAGLPRGENVLTIQPAPRPPGSTRRRPPEPYVIPFWW